MNKNKNILKKFHLHPIMSYVLLIVGIIILSGVLSFIGVESSYKTINQFTGTYETNLVSVHSLFSLSGLKYIFTSTIANFVSFAPLSNLIIILIGIGVMEKSNFLNTAFTILTRGSKKYTITFVLVLIGILASVAGDISYAILIPISALLYKYGHRNPLLGIVTIFAALTCGSGLNVFITSIDSSLITLTNIGAQTLDASYSIGVYSFVFIMGASVLLLAFLITMISEKIIAPRLPKNEEKLKENRITKRELRGLILGLSAGVIYLIIFIYNIIPGLPFSGNLLDNSQALYIDKLFSYNSFFSNGFVFIISMLFVILGLFFGFGAKTIKNNQDFATCLGHSLDDIGKTLVLILFASIFINIFKKSEIGTVIVAAFSNLIASSSFMGLPLIILVFLLSAVSSLFISSSILKWSILSGVTVPVLMNAGISAEFSQVIFRFGESALTGLTPLLASFVIYLAYFEKYSNKTKPIGLFESIKYMVPYSVITAAILLLLIISWFIIGLPIGIGISTVI